MRSKANLLALIALAVSLALTGCNKTQTAGNRSDGDVANDVQGKINSDGNLPDKMITVNANHGVVTLTGTVGSEAERQSAANDAAAVDGVKTVVNNLQVGNTSAAAAPAAAGEMVSASNSRRSTSRSQRPPAQNFHNVPANTAPASNSTPTTPQAAPASAAPPAPVNLTIPVGTNLTVRTIDAIDSEKAQNGDVFSATLDSPIEVDGKTAIPQGADIQGRIAEVQSAGHFEGHSLLVLELTKVSYAGHSYRISTSKWQKEGASRGKNTAAKVGGGAAVGAIIGAIAGGGRGAAIGAGAGAAAGTGAQAITHGQQIVLRPETLLSFSLNNPVTVTPASSYRGGSMSQPDSQQP